jgi:hypothetical protein
LIVRTEILGNLLILLLGWVAERFKAPVLKTGVGASPPWVRIPPHPPHAARPNLRPHRSGPIVATPRRVPGRTWVAETIAGEDTGPAHLPDIHCAAGVLEENVRPAAVVPGPDDMPARPGGRHAIYPRIDHVPRLEAEHAGEFEHVPAHQPLDRVHDPGGVANATDDPRLWKQLRQCRQFGGPDAVRVKDQCFILNLVVIGKKSFYPGVAPRQ